MTGSRHSSRSETALFVFLGFLAIASILGIVILLMTSLLNSENLRLAPLCLGPLAGAVGGLVMLCWRRRNSMGWRMPLGAIMAFWLAGLSMLGLGALTLLIPAHAASRAASPVPFLCLAPGAFLALLALAVWRYPRRFIYGLNLGGSSSQGASGRLAKLHRAKAYRARIARFLRRRQLPEGVQVTRSVLDRSLERLELLAERLETYECNDVIQRDFEEVPRTIARLTRLFEIESDPTTRGQIVWALASLRSQEEHLAALAKMMQRTELVIDEAVASMGALDAQLHLITARGMDSRQVERLGNDLGEQVTRLGDLLSALDEVQRS